jgi:hypothetical protein
LRLRGGGGGFAPSTDDAPSDEPLPELFVDPDAWPEPELFADPDALLEPELFTDPDALLVPPEPFDDPGVLADARFAPGRERVFDGEPGPEREDESDFESGFDVEALLAPFVTTSAFSAACADCPRPRKSAAIPPAAPAFSPSPLTVSAAGFGNALVVPGPDLGPEPFGLLLDGLAVLSTAPTPATAMRGPTRFRTTYC